MYDLIHLFSIFTCFQKSSGDTAAPNKPRTPVPQGKYAERYKYVRFVEKKKVLRKMKQLQQELIKNPDTADKESIESQLAGLRKDLTYIQNFPGDKKYISLFPSGGPVSETCTKQREVIVETIITKKVKQEQKQNQQAKLDVIKSDDFFVDPASPPRVPKPKTKQQESKKNLPSKPTRPTVHPSWDAKKNNEKLTGLIAGRKFQGKKITFDD